MLLFILNILLVTMKNVKLNKDYFGYYISFRSSAGLPLRRGCFLNPMAAFYHALVKF